jgi:hypothetical protein
MAAAEMEAMAGPIFDLYNAYMKCGFNEKQAMELTKDFQSKMLEPMMSALVQNRGLFG